MNRTIEIHTNTSFGIATLLPGLPPAALWTCNVDLTLLLIGLLTSPPKFKALSLSHYWAWLRYLVALHPSGKLRLRLLWREIDSHQKTLLSDDFGTGFPCHYLIDNHGFEDFADTGYLLKNVLNGFVSLLGSNMRGPSKSPDFIAVDNLGRLHILECKGTQSSRADLIKAIERGIPQKNNLSNSGLFTSSMVGGFFVPQHRSKEAAQIVFADPPESELLKPLADLGRARVAEGVRRISLAKSLSMAGLWTAATAISEEIIRSANINFVRRLADGELRFAGYVKNDETGNWERTISLQSLEQRAKSGNTLVPVVTTLTVIIPASVELLFMLAVNENGTVNRKEIDLWIAEQLTKTRALQMGAESELTQDRKVGDEKKVGVQLPKSSWSKVASNGFPLENSPGRGWRTGTGLQFLLEHRTAGN